MEVAGREHEVPEENLIGLQKTFNLFVEYIN